MSKVLYTGSLFKDLITWKSSQTLKLTWILQKLKVLWQLFSQDNITVQDIDEALQLAGCNLEQLNTAEKVRLIHFYFKLHLIPVLFWWVTVRLLSTVFTERFLFNGWTVIVCLVLIPSKSFTALWLLKDCYLCKQLSSFRVLLAGSKIQHHFSLATQ